MATYAGQPSSFYSATGGVPQEGAWYSGRRYLNGQLLNPGEYEPGKMTSNETIAQTNPNNVSYIDQQIKANQIQAPVTVPLVSGASSSYMSGLNGSVEAARNTLQTTLATQKAETEAKIATLRQQESETLKKVGELSTPFREDLEKTERERLYVNKNFEENQTLVNELDQLLTEGNNLIKQQQEVTGLAAVRNPRIQQTMNDVAARAGVIEAVISARNGQIAQAYTLIDRSIGAITSDRQDQLNYYSAILNLNNRDLLMLDADSKRIAQEQTNILKNDLTRAESTVDYVKQLMLDPAKAQIMGEAGVSLNDSVETINSKLRQAQQVKEVRDMNNAMAKDGYTTVINPGSVPANQLVTLTDSIGNKYYYKKSVSSGSGMSANDFILQELAKSGSSGTGSVSVPASTYSLVKSLASEVATPSMSPSAGIGSRYTDALGRVWIYESTGWRLTN